MFTEASEALKAKSGFFKITQSGKLFGIAEAKLYLESCHHNRKIAIKVCKMKSRKIFVFMQMIAAMTTVYGQEKFRTKPASTQLSIYSLPPLERAISCIKFYEGWHGEKRHWSYVGWGYKVLPGEECTNDITKAQGDSILRVDMMKLCRLFSRFGLDSILLACLAYQIGAYRLLGTKDAQKQTYSKTGKW